MGVRLLALLGLLATALVLAAPAAADSRGATDPRGDTKGSHWPGPEFTWLADDRCWAPVGAEECGDNDYFEDAGPLLDIAAVRHGHRGSQITHRVTMARNWQSGLLGARGGQISLYFSLDRDAAFERRLDLYLRGGKPAAIMRAGSRSVGSATVTRPNRKTVEVRFARRLLAPKRVTYRWFAFAGIVCKRKYERCGDRSPGARVLAHSVR